MNDKNKEVISDNIEASPVSSEVNTPEQFVNRETEKDETTSGDSKKQVSEKNSDKKIHLHVKRTVKPIPKMQDEVVTKIEKILESGLADEYAKLSPIAKQEFKIKGEETSIKIRELLNETHVKVKKIFYLIIEWLRVLPGINKFFLEQEAKIKTDLIIELHHKQKEKIANRII